MGWLILAIFAALAFAALWFFVRPDKAGLQLVAAAILFACAGYAWQGHPDLIGDPHRPAERESVAADSAFSAIPRLAVFLVSTLLLMPWMLKKMTAYTVALLGDLGRYAR